MPDHNNKCPECGRQLFFGGDGRSRQCEFCGYKQTIHKPVPSPAEIARTVKYAARFTRSDAREDVSFGVRTLLLQGIEAAKEGHAADAYYYLEWVLRSEASDAQYADAWLWLSKIYDEAADKRLCLEHALAHQPLNPIARRGIAVLDGRLQADEIIDPNQQRERPAAGSDPQAVKTEQFQCPRCAARMNYTPDNKALVCEFCHYRQELDTPEAHVQTDYGIGGIEKDFIAALSTAKGHSQPVAMRLLQCMGCAVEFVLAPETLSLTCPYCDAVYVTETAETRELLPPQALIPFATTQDDVKLTLRAWVKQHKIERPRVSPIVGMYVPVWTFDIGGELIWRGFQRRGDNWVQVSGSHHLLRDDVLIPATQKRSKPLGPAIHEFDYDGLVAYDSRFLADWPAERYQLTLAEASLQARKQVVTDIRRHSHQLTDGESIKDFSLNTMNMVVESYKLILLPLWLIHLQVDDAMYDVVVNGQNGRVYGEHPQSLAGKLFSWIKQ